MTKSINLTASRMTAAAILALGLFAFVGCARQSTVIGKWRQEKANETVEYFKDGTFVATTAQGRTMTGKYTILDERRMKIELAGPLAVAGPFISNYNISGDEMTMSAPDGTVGTYHRAE